MLIKKISLILFIAILFSFKVYSVEPPVTSARSAVVIDSNTNEVIYQKNMSDMLSMASTTKIMTSILAVESGKLHCTVKAERDVVCEGTSIGIKKGDCFTLETLVWAMLLESGNDAAVLTAEYLAGSEEDFAVMMNEKAAEIGMENTNFVTASGLDDEEHFSTAYDMALLASYAIKNPIFRQMCSSQSYSARYVSPDISVTYSNHNRLLDMYEGVFGVKTGFTKKSGRCLVSACERDGVTLVAVTLKAPDDWNDHKKMYDYGFAVSKLNPIETELPQSLAVYGGEKASVSLRGPEININNFNDSTVTYRVHIPDFLYAPIAENDKIGTLTLYINNKKVDEYPITAAESVGITEGKKSPEYNLFDKLKYFLSELF